MLRKGPLAKLAANPDATSIYNQSRALDKQIMEEPEWDIATDNIRMQSIIQERNYAPIKEKQEKMRDEAKKDAKENKKKIEEVRKRQENLRQRFINLNNFMCDSERKIVTLEKEIAAEQAADRQMDKDIKELEEKLAHLKEYQEKDLEPSNAELSAYEEVIQKMVDESDLFKSKEDFIDRCNALLLAQAEVKESDEANLKELEESRAKIVKMSNEFSLKYADMENQLADLEKQYEKAKVELLKWENVLPAAKDVVASEEMEIHMLLDQIQQLYLLFCQRSGVEPKFKREEVDEQLDFIKDEIEILTEIIKSSHEMMELETRSDIAEHGSGKSGIPRK